MQKTEEKTEYPKLTPLEFELILEKYGMTKTDYCQLRGKCRSWFYEVLRAKQFVPIIDMETLVKEIGHSVFDALVETLDNEDSKNGRLGNM